MRPVPSRSARSAGPVRSVSFCSADPVRSVSFCPVQPVLSRPAAGCCSALRRRAADRTLPPTSTRFRHIISPHSLFIALARSLALLTFFRRLTLCRLCCLFSCSLWTGSLPSRLRTPWAGVLPVPSCRPVPAARFRSGSTDGKEGRVVGKIGKLSVISKSVNPGRSASAGWRLLIG